MIMQNTGILDQSIDQRYASLTQPAAQAHAKGLLPRLALFGILLAAIGLVFAAVLGGRLMQSPQAPAKTISISLDQQREIAAMNVEDKSQILAKGIDAQLRNAEIPVSALPVEAVSALKFGMVDGNAQATALRCLTQAVYYEAANEPLQGRRAVAQVVLNRMRHPAYPNSVCSVVYQGIERGWGCQFSFVCDGALLRTPATGLWREAQAVAQAALGGYVEASVGTATHYHADYVLPKWAFNLGKITQLGRHIFYRFNGNMGRTTAFNARYSGAEAVPMINFAALQTKLGSEELLAVAPVLVEGLTVPPEVTDRHAPADVGGRLDVTKTWRLAIPDPVAASSRYRQALGQTGDGAADSAAAGGGGQPAVNAKGLAAAEPLQAAVAQ
jgi:spore germination cell wall hydrolase CwlJ-like protein